MLAGPFWRVNTDYHYTGKESQTTDGIFTSIDPLAKKISHLCRNDTAGEDFVSVVEGGELAGGDAPLGLVEEDVQPAFAAEDPGVLQGLAIPDADPVTSHPAKGRKTTGTDLVYFFR